MPARSLFARIALPVAAFAGFAACSPSLDWREVALDGDGVLLMPCKPERVARTVSVAGASAQGTMWVCDAGGYNWSVTSMRFEGEAQAAAASMAVAQALAANLGTTLGPNPAMEEGAHARRTTLVGRRPAGQPVTAWARLSRRGGTLLQQVILGPEGTPLPVDADDRFLRDPARDARP
jgi:hypothetical protein